MDIKNLPTNRCSYVIVTGTTLESLEENVNDLIEQGWHAERFIGGIEKDQNGYFQAMYVCPLAEKAVISSK